MSIDFARENLLTVAEATRKIPGRPSIRTVWRWINQGVAGVQLETIKCGGKRLTSDEAIHRFVNRSTNPSSDSKTHVSDQRQREITRAERELQQAGF